MILVVENVISKLITIEYTIPSTVNSVSEILSRGVLIAKAMWLWLYGMRYITSVYIYDYFCSALMLYGELLMSPGG